MLIFLSLVLELSSSLTHQLAQIYGEHREHEDDGTFDDGTFIIYYVRMITCNNFFICYTVILACHVPHVQQQVGTYDCGIFICSSCSIGSKDKFDRVQPVCYENSPHEVLLQEEIDAFSIYRKIEC